MERYTLDTHALLWYFAESSSLTKTAEKCLDQADRGDAIVFVPTIVLAEALSVCEN